MISLLFAVLIASKTGNQQSTQATRLCGRGASVDSGEISAIKCVRLTFQQGAEVNFQVAEHSKVDE